MLSKVDGIYIAILGTPASQPITQLRSIVIINEFFNGTQFGDVLQYRIAARWHLPGPVHSHKWPRRWSGRGE